MNHSEKYEITKAERKDLVPVRALLDACNLPFDDIRPDILTNFFIARQQRRIVGVIGLEPYSRYGLLRSLAVKKKFQENGLGSALVTKLEEQCRVEEVGELYLLTTTAEPFFRARGYDSADRDRAPDAIQSTREFSTICSESATLMKKVL